MTHGTSEHGDSGQAIWRSPAWRQRAVAWLDGVLAAAGVQRTGDVEQPHLRPWSTALCAPTSRGRIWLKAPGPGARFEVGLYALLARVVPQHVLEPLAVDVVRGWVVLPDGGATLGDSCSGDALASGLTEALPRYAELQRELMPHAAELLACGVADMRPARMPERFAEALAVADAIARRSGTPEDAALIQRVRAFEPTFASWCRELEAAPASPSLDHNDLHPWNIFVGGPAARAKFYDWGYSVVAHPFASLLVALGILREQLQLAASDVRLLRVRDAYLEVFADLASPAELLRASELACRVAKIARALVWQRALLLLGPDEAPRFERAPLRWVAAVLDAEVVGVGG
jgi:hypothetical protein